MNNVNDEINMADDLGFDIDIDIPIIIRGIIFHADDEVIYNHPPQTFVAASK